MKVVVSGTNSIKLAKNIARRINAKFVGIEYKKFPDGESYVRLKENIPKGAEALIVQTLYPQNDSIVELFFLLDLVSEFKPKNISLIIPYFAYARQHKRYRKWEAISSKTFAKLLQNFNIERIFTIDLHSNDLIKFFDLEVVHLSTTELIAKYFLRKNLKNPFVLIPDQEREWMAKKAAKILNCDYSYLKKYRSRVTGEIKTEIFKDFDLRGKDVILMDDIISTGKTMINAIEIVKRKEAKNIFVSCVHYIPSEVYKEMLNLGAKEVISTNTIQSEVSKIDVAPLIVDSLKSIWKK